MGTQVERKRKELLEQLAMLNHSEDKIKELEATQAQLITQMIEAEERVTEYRAKIARLEQETQQLSKNIEQENKVLSGVSSLFYD
jgi:septal ring factor EnvC (AmiA/AmiB activator)